ncbi:hypothetical protein MY1884_009231 [Beauveria asiatica]
MDSSMSMSDNETEDSNLLAKDAKNPFDKKPVFFCKCFLALLALSLIANVALVGMLLSAAAEKSSSYETGFASDLASIKHRIELIQTRYTGGVELDHAGHFSTDASGPQYVGNSSKVIDLEWEKLLSGLNLDLTDKDIGSTATFQWPESGMHLTGLEVYHSLHCLGGPRVYWVSALFAAVVALLYILGSADYKQFCKSYNKMSQKLVLWYNGNLTLDSFQCLPQPYTIEILSVDPFVIYINDFLSEYEIQYLLEYASAQEHHEDIDMQTNSASLRLAWRNRGNVCIAERMKSLLGNVQHLEIEPIRIIQYEGEQKLQVHYDWFPGNRTDASPAGHPNRVNNRLGSIFAYLEDDCDGGETYFPEIRGVAETADGRKFSRTESGEGLLVKPLRGNAVFWNNLHSDGSGDVRTAHAGLPVTRGRKIGINIWSYYFVDTAMVGQ